MVIWLVRLALADPAADEALVAAAHRCAADDVAAALQRGANPDAEVFWRPPATGFLRSLFPGRRTWTTPLQGAVPCALDGRERPLRQLLEAGADSDYATRDHAPVLHEALAAAGEGNPRGVVVAERLLSAGAAPLARYRGRAAAHALYGKEPRRGPREGDGERVLLAAGVPEGELLCAAAEEGDVDAVVAGIEAWPAWLDGPCAAGSPLLAATGNEQLGTVTALLDAGARRDAASQRIVAGGWITPVHAAVAAGWADGLQALLVAGAPPDLPSGPSWAAPSVPLVSALRASDPAERAAMVELLVGAGASRAVWAPVEDGWRTVFHPGDGLDDQRGARPLAPSEQAVAVVSQREHARRAGTVSARWGDALSVWGPATLSALWAESALDALPEARSAAACAVHPTARGLRRAHGRPERTQGIWAQQWTWPGARAQVVRDRRPGRWHVLSATGDALSPCQGLIDHPVSHALLSLGPPTAASGARVRWGDGVAQPALEATVRDGQVVEWRSVLLTDGR